MNAVDPKLLAAFDQESANLRGWLTMLAQSWPDAVAEFGEATALVTLAKHIEGHVYNSDPRGVKPTGWVVAAVAVTAISRALQPPDELPPLGSITPPVVPTWGGVPPNPPRTTDANGECTCHINPPCSWCTEMCCAGHLDLCLAGWPGPCCERCPDES